MPDISHPVSAPRPTPTRPRPLKSNFLAEIVGLFGVMICGACSTNAQLIVQEDFESFAFTAFSGGINSGGGQWNNYWTVDNTDRMTIVENRSKYSKKLPGMGSVSGLKNALELRTSTGSSLAFRNYNGVDIPFYVSFLFSIESVGTGGGFLDILLYSGSQENVVMRFVPDIERQEGAFYFKGTSGSYNSIPNLPRGEPFLVIMKIQHPELASSAAIRVDPTLTTTYSDYYAGGTGPQPNYFGGVGFRVGRDTISGTDSIFRIDELKIGITRLDVVPDASPLDIVKNYELEMIPRLKFYSESGRTYYIQKSFDLNTWNHVSTVIGNNAMKEWIDGSYGKTQGFYRIVLSP